jgi:hypothetical protein
VHVLFVLQAKCMLQEGLGLLFRSHVRLWQLPKSNGRHSVVSK